MYDELLIHECEVLVRSGAKDRFGQPIEPTSAANPGQRYACRLTNASGGERWTDRTRDVVVKTYKLFLQAGIELYEADRVTVRDARTGRTLAADAEVTDVTTPDDWQGPHHVEAKISVTQSGERP